VSDYVLEIRYGQGEPPVQARLSGCTPEEAESKRQAVARHLDHAIEMHSPPISLHDIDADLPEDVEVDPTRVVDVALIDDAG
jgi:hypothetical protein